MSQIVFLLKRIMFTIAMILLYRIGVHIPLPYGSIVTEKMLKFFNAFNVIYGGALSRGSVFSLSIMPYIVSSIVIQLLSSADKGSSNDQSGNRDKFKVRIWTMCIALVQGSFLILSSNKFNSFFSISVIVNLLSLVSGSLLLMWIGEIITLHGIGNGISLIIFTGVIAEIPSAIAKNINALSASAITIEQFIIALIIVLLLIIFIVFVESSAYNVPVNYVNRQSIGMKKGSSFSSARSYIPLKINTAGVIPPIFANAVLMLPLTVLGFYRTKYNIVNLLVGYLLPGSLLYNAVYITLIVFFCFFYTFIVFDPDKAADNIKKGGGVIFGYRPGKDTSIFLRSIVNKLIIIGVVYIVIICMSTEIMRFNGLPSFIVGGTSLLIVVGVVMDTLAQIQMYIFSGKYNKILKKTGLRRRS